MKKNRITAVFKEDLQKILYSINEIEPLTNGERLCVFCGKVMTINNIQLIIPRSDNIFDFVCDHPICIEKYNRKK